MILVINNGKLTCLLPITLSIVKPMILGFINSKIDAIIAKIILNAKYLIDPFKKNNNNEVLLLNLSCMVYILALLINIIKKII